MVDALAGQVALGQDLRHIAPQVGLERINREDVDLDAGLDERPHVAGEEGAHLAWKAVGENRES